MANYQLVLRDPFGNQLAVIDDFISLDYVRVTNGIGSLTLTLSKKYDALLFIGGDVKVDNRLEVQRQIGNGNFYLDTQMQWLIRAGQKTLDDTGQRLTIINALCLNTMLNRRIVAYATGSAQADKTTFADDMMKAIVAENLGASAVDTARTINALYLAVQGNAGAAQNIAKAFSRRILLPILQELALASYQAGTYLAFDMVANTNALFEFRTYIGQRGIDRRQSSANPVLLGPEFGNLTNVVRGYDHIQEVTYGYAGGQGVGASRLIGTATDANRVNASPFNRIEKFLDGRLSTDLTHLNNDANSLVKDGLPKNTFKAEIVDTPATTYGLHYNFGDFVTAIFEGETIDCRIEQVRVTVKNKDELIKAVVQASY